MTNLFERLFVEERCRLKIIPNALGEKSVLNPMFGAMIRGTELWRAIWVIDFEHRQMAAIRKELNHEHGARNGLASKSSRDVPRQNHPAVLKLDPQNNRRTFDLQFSRFINPSGYFVNASEPCSPESFLGRACLTLPCLVSHQRRMACARGSSPRSSHHFFSSPTPCKVP